MEKLKFIFLAIALSAVFVSCNDNAVHDYLTDLGEFITETQIMYDNGKLDEKTWKEREMMFVEFTGSKFDSVKGKMSEANMKTYEELVKDFEKISVKQDPLGHIPELLGF